MAKQKRQEKNQLRRLEVLQKEQHRRRKVPAKRKSLLKREQKPNQ